MASIASLFIDLRAGTDSLDKDIKKGVGSMKKAAADIGKIAAGIGVAAAGAFGVMAKQAIDTADQFAKMSRSVGVSTETLSALSHAAQLSGTNVETVQKSLGRLAGNAADASMGIGTAKDAFAALGITVTDAEGNLKPMESLMLDVADRFAEMEDGTEKTALAMDIFGRSGMDLIPMLNQGSEGIRSMMTEAEQLGLVIDSKTAASSERFNDALLALSKAGQGVVNIVLSSGLLDGLVVLAESFSELVIESDKTNSAFGLLSDALVLPIKGFFKVEEGIANLRSGFADFIVEVLEMVDGAHELLGAWSPFGSVVDNLQGKMESWALTADQAADEAAKWKEKNDLLTQGLKDSRQPVKDLTSAIGSSTGGGLIGSMQAAQRTQEEAKKILDEVKKSMENEEKAARELERFLAGKFKDTNMDLTAGLRDQVAEFEKLSKKLAGKEPLNLIDAFEEAGIAGRTFGDVMLTGDGGVVPSVNAAVENMNKVLMRETTDEGTGAFPNMTRAAEVFKGSFIGAIDEMVNGVIGPGKAISKIADAFKNMGVNILRDLTESLFTPFTDLLSSVVKGIVDTISGGVSKFVSSFVGTATGGAAGSALGAGISGAGGAAGLAIGGAPISILSALADVAAIFGGDQGLFRDSKLPDIEKWTRGILTQLITPGGIQDVMNQNLPGIGDTVSVLWTIRGDLRDPIIPLLRDIRSGTFDPSKRSRPAQSSQQNDIDIQVTIEQDPARSGGLAGPEQLTLTREAQEIERTFREDIIPLMNDAIRDNTGGLRTTIQKVT